MTPADWLILACVACVILGGIIGALIDHPIAFDRGFEEACGNKRHRHRIGSPQETTLIQLPPRAGRPAPEPWPELDPELGGGRPVCVIPGTGPPQWRFFGDGQQVLPQPGRDEYALLTAPVMTQTTQTMTVTTATATVETRTDETPSAWTKRMGLEMDAYISKMREESNYFQHMILADHLSLPGGHEAAS
jgi:hypothetical protein